MASDRLKIRLKLVDFEAKTEVIMPYCNRCDKLTCAALCRDCFPDEYYKTIKFCDCGKLADIVVTPPVSLIQRGASLSESSLTPESKKGTQDSSAKTPVAAKKAKIVADGKTGGHADTPRTAKKKKTSATDTPRTAKNKKTSATDRSDSQTPKSAHKKVKHSTGK